MHSLCTILYYLAKSAIAVYQVIVICCKDINSIFIYCLLYTYTGFHDEIFEPEFLLPKRKISPEVIFQRVNVQKEIYLAVIYELRCRLSIEGGRAIARIVHRFHIKEHDLFLLIHLYNQYFPENLPYASPVLGYGNEQ